MPAHAPSLRRRSPVARPAALPRHSLLTCLASSQVDLAEEPTRRSGMLSDSGGQSALPQLHVNGKVWPL